MKFQVPPQGLSRGRSPMSDKGFTLPEIMIALTVFLFVIAGIVFANLFGLNMFQITQTKLNVTQWSRETIENLSDEVHACNSLSILNVDTNGNFTGLLPGETQQGNGLQIYPTTDTNTYTIYFVNPPDETFRQTVTISGVSTNTVILGDSVTNTVAFSAQDLSGNVLTNSENNQVIHLTLEFYQPQLFMKGADYYKLETSMKQRLVQ
jgi:prepilin-type N-terminal cleavage/methylation domain-containing protein